MMADKRLVDFPAKPAPVGSDISYFGDSSDGFREVKSTLDEFNAYQGSIEVTTTRFVDTDLFGKNVVSNNALSIVLTIQLNSGFPVGSQFVMVRNTPGAFDLHAVTGVTINGVDQNIIELSDQYDRAVVTNISDNEWVVNKYSGTKILPDPNRVVFLDGAGNLATSAFLPYDDGSALLGSDNLTISAGIISAVSGSKVFPLQNGVSSNRALTSNDLGVLLRANGANRILNLPAAGDATLAPTSAFWITQRDANQLTVQAPAGVSLNDVVGGSVSTQAVNDMFFIYRAFPGGINNWYAISIRENSALTYQGIYDNDSTATTQLSESKDLVFKSFEESLAFVSGIAAGGAGYATNDIITVSGGTFTDPVQLRASIVSGGVITQVLPVERGDYTVIPANPVSVTGGTGTGAQFNLFFEKSNFVKHRKTTSISGGLSVGQTGSVPNYAIARFGGNIGDNRGVAFPILGADSESRLMAKLPLNGLLWYNSFVGRFRTSIANVARSIPTEEDITLENAYGQGDGKITLNSGKPFVLNSTVAGVRDPEMTLAQFSSIPGKIDGEKAFASDTQRPVIETSSGIKQVAYTDDVPASVVPSYGEMHFTDNGTETVILAPATPVKIIGTYLADAGLLSEFTHVNGTLTYTGAGDNFKITAILSCTMNVASETASVIIYHNGSPITKSKQQHDLGSSSPAAKNIASMALISLATNDTIEVWIQNDNSEDNITVKQFYCIPEELAGGAGTTDVTTLQEAYEAQPDGTITLPVSGKDFIVKRGDISLDVFKITNSSVDINEKTTIFAGEGTSPFELTNQKNASPNQSIKTLISDVRNPAISAATVYEMQIVGNDSLPTQYDIFKFDVFKTDVGFGSQKTRITYSTFHNGSTKELLKFDGDTESIYFGDPIIPKSLTNAEIGARTNIPTELLYNSDDDRFEYTDLTNTQRKIANTDDIVSPSSGSANLTFGTPIGIVGGSAGITVSRQFYVKTGSIVNIKCVLQFTVNASAVRIQINLPFSPQFNTTEQATGIGSMAVDSDVTANDGSKLISTTSQTVLNDTLRLDMLAVNNSGSYRLDVDFMYEIQ